MKICSARNPHCNRPPVLLPWQVGYAPPILFISAFPAFQSPLPFLTANPPRIPPPPKHHSFPMPPPKPKSPTAPPRMVRHCRARYLPSSLQRSLSDFRVGTTTAITGMGGRNLATKLMVRPEAVSTTISPAAIFSAVRVALLATLSSFCR